MIIFRADASLILGHGHVMRCLALADAFRSLGENSLFIFSKEGNALAQEVVKRGYQYFTLTKNYNLNLDEGEIMDARETLTAMPGSTRLVVADHYHLQTHWERIIKNAALPLLVIDDLFRHHMSDFLLDQNIITAKNNDSYKVPKTTSCFFGPTYALLSSSFQDLRNQVNIREYIETVLIFFGGSDQDNETEKALLGTLSTNKDFHIDVVVGSSNPHKARLLEICHDRNITLHVQTPHMAKLMLDADLAIGAGGSASWERCCMGLPSIVSIQADNQTPIATVLHQLGAAYNLGMTTNLTSADYKEALLSITPQTLRKMSNAALSITDGKGAIRVASCILTAIEDMQ